MSSKTTSKPQTAVQAPVGDESFDFNQWAAEVRQQMVASLKRRGVR